MKKSIEQQAKEAFDKWDNTSTDIGFDKKAVWERISNEKQVRFSFVNVWKVAAVLVILLLSSSVFLLMWQNNELRKQQIAQVPNVPVASKKEPVINKEPEKVVEVCYQTKVKEVTPPAILKELEQMQCALSKFKEEQEQLYREKESLQVLMESYQDSIRQMNEINKELLVMVDQWQQAKQKGSENPFEIEIDEEALLALSTDAKNEASREASGNKVKIGLKRNRYVKESTAPIFGDMYSD